jgi:hypothetical protein
VRPIRHQSGRVPSQLRPHGSRRRAGVQGPRPSSRLLVKRADDTSQAGNAWATSAQSMPH